MGVWYYYMIYVVDILKNNGSTYGRTFKSKKEALVFAKAWSKDENVVSIELLQSSNYLTEHVEWIKEKNQL